MAELFEYLGFGIGFLSLFALIELTLVIVFIVLAIRYLYHVPKCLNKISDRLATLDENQFALNELKINELQVLDAISCSLDDMANNVSNFRIDK